MLKAMEERQSGHPHRRVRNPSILQRAALGMDRSFQLVSIKDSRLFQLGSHYQADRQVLIHINCVPKHQNMDARSLGWILGWILGWMDTGMDGYVDGWILGWMDTWMDGIVTVFDREGARSALFWHLDVNGRWRRVAPEVDRCPLTAFLLQFIYN